MAKISLATPAHCRATALAVLLGSSLAAGPALATAIFGAPQGGQGGTGSAGVGGAGGTFNTPQGSNGSGNSGGGGGGPGGRPGSGGAGGGRGGAGGMNGSLAGTPIGTDGDNGSSAPNSGGGGGAGGIGAVQTGAGTVGQAIQGGAGGAGGRGNNGGGGDGGDGGSGLFLNHASGPVTIERGVIGGNGGAGGNGGGIAGNGGSGGTGLLLSQSFGPVVVKNDVTGGNGGAAGASSGGDLGGYGGDGGDGAYVDTPLTSTGSTSIVNKGVITGGSGGNSDGGQGVAGRNLTLTNAGTVQGGLGDHGNGARADAIRFFPGGPNRLNLRQGSTINGTVVANSGDDTLALGGSRDAAFNVDQIGGGQQYRGFESFQKTGGSTWTLTGQGNQKWAVTDGILQVGVGPGSSADTGGDISVQSGGALGGYGTAGGDVTIAHGAAIDPGAPNGTGTLSVAGDLAMNGTFDTAIAGPNDFDQLAVAGTAAFGSGSQLDLNALSDFSFRAGQSFDVLTASTIDNLMNLGLPELASGLSLNASSVRLNGKRALRLSVAAAGGAGGGTVNAVPAPGSLGLFAIGLSMLGLGGLYRRRA